jgi:hypothetical protein
MLAKKLSSGRCRFSSWFVTGLAIWDAYFFPYTTIDEKRIAVLVHSIAAVAAMAVLIVTSTRASGCAVRCKP